MIEDGLFGVLTLFFLLKMVFCDLNKGNIQSVSFSRRTAGSGLNLAETSMGVSMIEKDVAKIMQNLDKFLQRQEQMMDVLFSNSENSKLNQRQEIQRHSRRFNVPLKSKRQGPKMITQLYRSKIRVVTEMPPSLFASKAKSHSNYIAQQEGRRKNARQVIPNNSRSLKNGEVPKRNNPIVPGRRKKALDNSQSAYIAQRQGRRKNAKQVIPNNSKSLINGEFFKRVNPMVSRPRNKALDNSQFRKKFRAFRIHKRIIKENLPDINGKQGKAVSISQKNGKVINTNVKPRTNTFRISGLRKRLFNKPVGKTDRHRTTNFRTMPVNGQNNMHNYKLRPVPVNGQNNMHNNKLRPVRVNGQNNMHNNKLRPVRVNGQNNMHNNKFRPVRINDQNNVNQNKDKVKNVGAKKKLGNNATGVNRHQINSGEPFVFSTHSKKSMKTVKTQVTTFNR